MAQQHSQRSFFLAPSELSHLKLLIQAHRTPQAVARRAQLIEASHTHPDWGGAPIGDGGEIDKPSPDPFLASLW